MRSYRAWLPYVLAVLVPAGGVVAYGNVCSWLAVRAEEREKAVTATAATLEVSDMADWLVSGAGDASFDGSYVEAGDHEGVAYYTIGSGVDTRYLFKDEGYWWLGRSLDWAGADYVSAGADLPGNPWDVQIGPSAPAPTVTEIIPPEEPPHFGTDHLIDAPYNLSTARMEWLDVGGTDHLFVLAEVAVTGNPVLLRYDLATNSWSTALAAVPDAIRDCLYYDTCAANDLLYVATLDQDRRRIGLWEYAPGADAWTERLAADTHELPSGSLWSLVRLRYDTASAEFVVAGSTSHTLFAGTQRTNICALTVDPATWTATYAVGEALGILYFDYGVTISVPEDDYLIDPLADIAWDDVTARELLMIGNGAYGIGGTGYDSGGPTIMSDGDPAAQNSLVVGAPLPDLGDDGYYYAFRRRWGYGSIWRVALDDPLPRFTQAFHRAPSSVELTVQDVGGLGDRLFVLGSRTFSGGTTALYEVDLRPQVRDLQVEIVGGAASVAWTFADGDLPGDAQTAYQVVVTDEGGTEVDDSGEVASAASSYEVSGLANGVYLATVQVWDRDGQASPKATRSFVVGGASGSDAAPTVSIASPLTGATITGDTTVTVEAADDLAVVSVALYVDGVLLGSLTAPNAGADYAFTWQVAGYGVGTHSISAVARDTAGQTATATISVTLDTAGDTTAPVVSITAPGSGATVGSSVPVTATATDDVAVVSVKLFADGQLQDTLTAPNDGSDYSFVWDSSGWANGSRTLRVTATDAAGNVGYDEVTVTLDRSKAADTKLLFLEQVPNAAVQDMWRSGVTIAEVVATYHLREAVPADETERYQVQAGIHVPGDSVNFDQYQLLRMDRVNTLQTQGSTFRVALKATPTLTVAYWDIAATAGLRLVNVPGDPGPLVFVTGDAELHRLSSSGYSLLASLPLATPADAAYVNGQILVAGEELFIVDLDSGELTWEAKLPSVTQYTAVAGGSDFALVGGTGAAVGYVYRFAYSSLTLVANLGGAAVNRINMAANGQSAALSLNDGTVQRWAGTAALTQLTATAEADASYVLDLDGVLYIGTGTDGEVWTRDAGGVSALDATLAAGTVKALARWNSRLFAAGLGDGALWRREGNSGWSQWYLLDGVTAIDDLLVDASGRLWVAATHSTGARIYRLEAATGGDFECGPTPPDVAVSVVRTSV